MRRVGVSRRSRRRHSGLEQVACAVELVPHLQVRPPPRGVEDLAPAVEIAVRLLGGRDELRRLAREALELRRRLAPELPGERLEPLVDVRVAEDHAAPLARRPSRRDPQVVERSGALELLRTAKKRDFPVHPLAVREQPVPDDDAAAVDRAESHPRGVCRRDARHDARRGHEHLVLVHGSPSASDEPPGTARQAGGASGTGSRPSAPSPSRWSRSGSVPCSTRPAQIWNRTRQPVWRSTRPGRSSGTSRPGRACVDARTASG